MQLAHYTRMLQAMDRHPEHVLLGGVIGTSDFTEVTGERYGIVWYDLEDNWKGRGRRRLRAAPSSGRCSMSTTTSSRSGRGSRRRHATVRSWCARSGRPSALSARSRSGAASTVGENDASFAITAGRLTDREWRYLYEQGLGTVDALAAATPTGPLQPVSEVAANLPARKRLSNVVRRARMQPRRRALERTTSDDIVVPDSRRGDRLRRGVAPGRRARLPMGCTGPVRQRRSDGNLRARCCRSTCSTTPALRLAQGFFEWMEGFVAEHEAAGRTVGIYHWTTPETRQDEDAGRRTRRAALRRPVHRPQRFMDQRFFARDGFSLKVVAPLFGFEWRAADAGGTSPSSRSSRPATPPTRGAAGGARRGY